MVIYFTLPLFFIDWLQNVIWIFKKNYFGTSNRSLYIFIQKFVFTLFIYTLQYVYSRVVILAGEKIRTTKVHILAA